MVLRPLDNGRFLSSLLYRSHVARRPHSLPRVRLAFEAPYLAPRTQRKRGRPKTAPGTLSQTGGERSELNLRTHDDHVEGVELNRLCSGIGHVAVCMAIDHVEIHCGCFDVLDNAGTDEVEAAVVDIA